jgi:hypothetical protein
MPTTPTPAELADARELLESSRRLRDDLLGAVGKLDSYIEQLREVTGDEPHSGATAPAPPGH